MSSIHSEFKSARYLFSVSLVTMLLASASSHAADITNDLAVLDTSYENMSAGIVTEMVNGGAITSQMTGGSITTMTGGDINEMKGNTAEITTLSGTNIDVDRRFYW